MRKQDKLKSMETANKRLLGESIPDEIQDRLTNLKSQYGLKDGEIDCDELKRRVRELIDELGANVEDSKQYIHTEDDLEGLSDIDSFYVGERAGEIDKSEEMIIRLQQILNP